MLAAIFSLVEVKFGWLVIFLWEFPLAEALLFSCGNLNPDPEIIQVVWMQNINWQQIEYNKYLIEKVMSSNGCHDFTSHPFYCWGKRIFHRDPLCRFLYISKLVLVLDAQLHTLAQVGLWDLGLVSVTAWTGHSLVWCGQVLTGSCWGRCYVRLSVYISISDARMIRGRRLMRCRISSAWLWCGLVMCFLIAGCPSCSSPYRMHHGRRSNGSQIVFRYHQSCVFKRQNSTGRLHALWQMSMWGTLYQPAKPEDSLAMANVEGFCGWMWRW